MAKYSYTALEKKYSGFISSAYKISVDGSELDDSYIVSSINVQLTALYEASYCEFEIKGGFDKTSEGYKLNKTLASKLKTGKKLTVSMGYKDKLTDVFSGYIDGVEIGYNAQSGFSVTVTALDGKGLMMNSRRSDIKTNVKKYSDAAKTIISAYSTAVDSVKATASAELEVPIAQLGESDYDFVVRLAKKINYSFYILLGKAYFIPYGSDNTVLLEINPEVQLKKLNLSTSLRRRVAKVVVVNSDETDEKKQIKSEVSKITGLGSGQSANAAAVSAIGANMTRTIVAPDATTPEIAKTYAEAEINRMSYSSVEGDAEMAGIPEMIPGVFVEIDSFGGGFDKKYYINKVVHRISGGRFTTTLELGGNEI